MEFETSGSGARLQFPFPLQKKLATTLSNNHTQTTPPHQPQHPLQPTLRSSSTLPLLDPDEHKDLPFLPSEELLIRNAPARENTFYIPGSRKMATPAPTSRTREAPQGDEEASSELKLGEFQDVDALTHSEAALVINALVSKRRGDRKNVNDTEYVTPYPR
jgi:hypothetical protein